MYVFSCQLATYLIQRVKSAVFFENLTEKTELLEVDTATKTAFYQTIYWVLAVTEFQSCYRVKTKYVVQWVRAIVTIHSLFLTLIRNFLVTPFTK